MIRPLLAVLGTMLVMSACSGVSKYEFTNDVEAAGAAGSSGGRGSAGTQGITGATGAGLNAGVLCDFYSVLAADEASPVKWDKMLADGTYKFTATLTNFDVLNQSNTDIFPGLTAAQQAEIGYADYALDCEGFLNAPETADYSFSQASDDGSQLVIDNQVIINMPEEQAMTSTTVTGVQLFAGLHKFNLQYFQGPPIMIGLTLQWQGPANRGLDSMAIIPASAFNH